MGLRTWRKEVKKLRRKRIRQQKAELLKKITDDEQKQKEASVEYKAWLCEQTKMETFRKEEEERIHNEENEKWLQTEIIAQKQWRELQEKISKARLERAQQDLRIKQEWEEEQRKIKEADEKRRQIEEEKNKIHQTLIKKIDHFISGKGELPEELLVIQETNPERELCPFYSKTSACRFGNGCSRNHRIPGISKVILATNFYTHFGMDHSVPNEYDTDILLEYDENDTYQHFEEFFSDVISEFEKFGKIIQFKVCCNLERHLRGNTYIEYSTLPEALRAYQSFHGRWYGGKQISLQFCDIPSWKRAICGLFAGKRCPKGRACNFLHVFKNPGKRYEFTNERSYRSFRDSLISHGKSRSRSKENNWRWSESPILQRKYSIDKHRSRSKDLDRNSKYIRTRRLRSVSRSRDKTSSMDSKHRKTRKSKLHDKNISDNKKSNEYHKSKYHRRSESNNSQKEKSSTKDKFLIKSQVHKQKNKDFSPR